MTAMDRQGYKSLLLVGPQAHSGVSAVTNNLAISLTYDGKRVLILDANSRRPAQHRHFGVAAEPGLIEVLAGTVKFEDAVVQIDSPRIDVLPVGHVSHAMPEMFEGSAFIDLLSQVKDSYDIILIDVSPALLTSDSSLMVKHVDAAAFVVRAMEDMRGMVGRMLRQLSGQRAEVLGVILNGVRSSAGGYFRKNYKAFYSYRQGSGSVRTRSKGDTVLAGEMAKD